MTEIKTVPRIPITEDVKTLCLMCRRIGYLSAHVDKDWADCEADEIVEYITDLFNAKREANIPQFSYHTTDVPLADRTTATPVPNEQIIISCRVGDTE